MPTTWKLDTQGYVELEAIEGLATALGHDLSIMLQLKTSTDIAAARAGRWETRQFSMTAPQARLLAQALLEAADRAEDPPPGLRN